MGKLKRRRARVNANAFLMIIVMAAVAYQSIMVSVKPPSFAETFKDYTSTQGASLSAVFDQLNSPYAILIRVDDRAILQQKNSEDKIYPASLTKMMTAILAIENLPDLQTEIPITKATFIGLYEANASLAGFQPGEKVKAIDLLYGAMLPSGAECCIALADYIAGSESQFVAMMNQKAEELGMKNTHFTNTIGLHNAEHYSTVKDMAILLSYALQNKIFKELFTSEQHTTQPTNVHPKGITVYSTLFKMLENPNFNGGQIPSGKILGGKTGYTQNAGLCLASLAEVDNRQYILVTAAAKGNYSTELYSVSDALVVYSGLSKSRSVNGS